MAKLKLKRAFIPLVVEFDGGSELQLRIDTQERGLFKRIQKLVDSEGEYKKLAKRLEEATASDAGFLETMAAGSLAREMAQTLKDGLVPFIGEDAYDEILAGLGEDKPIEAEDANFTMIEIFLEVERLIVEHFNNTSNRLSNTANRAAHYLSEAEHAQSEPNAE